MLKNQSTFIFALMLVASIVFVSCNDGADKKSETPASDTTKIMDSTGVTKPLKTVP